MGITDPNTQHVAAAMMAMMAMTAMERVVVQDLLRPRRPGATNCPEDEVTAVQVMPVMQPSGWHKEDSRLNQIQHELLDAARRRETMPAQ